MVFDNIFIEETRQRYKEVKIKHVYDRLFQTLVGGKPSILEKNQNNVLFFRELMCTIYI